MDSVKVSPWPLRATLLRVAIVPLIICIMFFKPTPHWPTICWFLFVMASLTDWLDGYLARKLESVTVMGKFLDPIADKALVSSVLIMFIRENMIEAFAVLLIINRDMIVSGARSMAAANGKIIAAGSLGKWKTTLQMVAIPSLFLSQSWSFLPFWEVGYYGIWLSVLLSLISGFQYVKSFLKTSSVNIL